MPALQDVHIRNTVALVAPRELKESLPLSDAATDHVASSRGQLVEILEGRDNRIFVIVGPCSIHNEQIAIDYAASLSNWPMKFRTASCWSCESTSKSREPLSGGRD